MSEFFVKALSDWLPEQTKAAHRVMEDIVTTERRWHEAQGAMKVLRTLQRCVENPALEFGSLWPLDEEAEEQETK